MIYVNVLPTWIASSLTEYSLINGILPFKMVVSGIHWMKLKDDQLMERSDLLPRFFSLRFLAELFYCILYDLYVLTFFISFQIYI